MVCAWWFLYGKKESKISLKPAAHVRKELSKMPREADSSAVSSRVRWSFGENFASRGEISNIKHVGYLRFRLARRNSHQNFTALERKRLSYLPREAFCSALSSRVRRVGLRRIRFPFFHRSGENSQALHVWPPQEACVSVTSKVKWENKNYDC